MAADFNDFLTALKSALGDFVETSLTSCKDDAIKVGEAFIQQTSADLQRWTGMLANGSLTTDEFDWLLLSKKDLIVTSALERAGLAQAALDRFTNGVINLVFTTTIKVFVP